MSNLINCTHTLSVSVGTPHSCQLESSHGGVHECECGTTWWIDRATHDVTPELLDDIARWWLDTQHTDEIGWSIAQAARDLEEKLKDTPERRARIAKATSVLREAGLDTETEYAKAALLAIVENIDSIRFVEPS